MLISDPIRICITITIGFHNTNNVYMLMLMLPIAPPPPYSFTISHYRSSESGALESGQQPNIR